MDYIPDRQGLPRQAGWYCIVFKIAQLILVGKEHLDVIAQSQREDL
jgi:hypothetical protein